MSNRAEARFCATIVEAPSSAPVLRSADLLDPRDPQHGIIASRLERASRWNRWLYHGFHSLDFPFMYYKRPLWDIVVIVLSIGGIAISVTSALPAWRRLVRHGRTMTGRRVPSWRPAVKPGPLAAARRGRTEEA